MSGLTKKLGIREGMRVLIANPPKEFAALLAELPKDVQVMQAPVSGVDCAIVFVRAKAEVAEAVALALASVKREGLVWFGYPKRTGGIKTDITRDTGWEPVYANGFDSVAQVSIDATWTGFRFREKSLIKARSR